MLDIVLEKIKRENVFLRNLSIKIGENDTFEQSQI